EPRGVPRLRALGKIGQRPPSILKLGGPVPLPPRFQPGGPVPLPPGPPSPRAARRPTPSTTAAPGRANVISTLAPPRLRPLVVAGKGGVGKTSCAAALALALAERDPTPRVLLLSTDPAHSLGDVLDTALGDEPREVAPGVVARELDAPAAFATRRARYRE